MYNINDIVKDLDILSEQIRKEKISIMKSEEKYKQREAYMWLNYNWEETLNKSRPTEKDKVFFITMDKEVKLGKRNMKRHQAKLNYLEKQFEIKHSLLKSLIGDC